MMLRKSSIIQESEVNQVVALPGYIPFDHPTTKWLLNTFRNGANNRLIAMLKERPYIFKHIFQITDCPAEVLSDPSDTKSLFSPTTTLYLRPLSLAVYMRCQFAIQILMNSSLSNPMEYGYASEVYVQLQGDNGGDLLEFLPACIAVRRQFFEALPLLFQNVPCTRTISCIPRTPFCIRYASKRIQRSIVYKDIFHYTTELAKTNRYINIVRTLAVLINRCHGFYTPGELDEVTRSESHSLFRRLIHSALYLDPHGRICLPLIQCMDLLVRNWHFRPENSNRASARKSHLLACIGLVDIERKWSELNEWIKDCLICAALLFHLDGMVIQRLRTGVVSHSGNVLFRVLNEMNLFEQIIGLPLHELATALDFLMSKDTVGQEHQRDKKQIFWSLSMWGDDAEQPEVTRPSDNTTNRVPFKKSRELLEAIINKLKARGRLARMRYMHWFSLSRTDYSVFKPLPPSRHRRASSYHKDNHRKARIPSNWRVHTDIQSASTTDQSINQGTEFIHTTVLSEPMRMTELGVPSSLPSDTVDYLSKNRCSLTVSQMKSQKLESSDVECTGVVRLSTAITATTNDQVRPESIECETTGGTRPCINGHDVVQAIDQPRGLLLPNTHRPTIGVQSESPDVCSQMPEEVKLWPTIISDSELVEQEEKQEIPHSDFAQKNTQSMKPWGIKRGRHLIQSSERSKAIWKKVAKETLSLQDVERLIDCITTNVLSNEQDLETHILEDLFNDYLRNEDEDSVLSSGVESVCSCEPVRQESKGTYLCTVNLRTTHVTPDGEHRSETQSVRPAINSSNGYTKAQIASINEQQVLMDQNLDNSNFFSDHAFKTDAHVPSNYRKLFWSCAKPTCHRSNTVTQDSAPRPPMNKSAINIAPQSIKTMP